MALLGFFFFLYIFLASLLVFILIMLPLPSPSFICSFFLPSPSSLSSYSHSSCYFTSYSQHPLLSILSHLSTSSLSCYSSLFYTTSFPLFLKFCPSFPSFPPRPSLLPPRPLPRPRPPPRSPRTNTGQATMDWIANKTMFSQATSIPLLWLCNSPSSLSPSCLPCLPASLPFPVNCPFPSPFPHLVIQGGKVLNINEE